MKNKVHEGGVGPTHDVVLTKMIVLVTNYAAGTAATFLSSHF